MSSRKEQKWIRDLGRGGKTLEAAMVEVYQDAKLWRQILAFVQRMGGTREDAEDIFQDGIQILILRLGQSHFQIDQGFRPYLVGVCRNLWYKKHARQQSAHQYEEELKKSEASFQTGPESLLLEAEVKTQVQTLLARLSAPCQQVLKLWKAGYSMKEIKAETGYSSEGMVRKKKHQCMKRLMEILESEPAWKAHLGR